VVERFKSTVYLISKEEKSTRDGINSITSF